MGLAERENKRSVVANLAGVNEEPNKKGRKEAVNQDAYTIRNYKIKTESYKKIKLRAFEEGKKDYEIVQEALDAYFSL